MCVSVSRGHISQAVSITASARRLGLPVDAAADAAAISLRSDRYNGLSVLELSRWRVPDSGKIFDARGTLNHRLSNCVEQAAVWGR